MRAPIRLHSMAMILFVTFLMVPALVPPIAAVEEGVTLSYEYHYGWTTVDMNTPQRQFLLGDLETDITPGAPALPVETLMLAVPPGQRLMDLYVRHSAAELVELVESYPCNPAVAPMGGGASVTDHHNLGAWNLAGTYILEGVEVVCVNLRPLGWDQTTGRVDLIRDFSISLLTESDAPGFIGDLDLVRELVDNPDAVSEMPRTVLSSLLPAGSYQHLIITDVSLSAPFQTLADWKGERNDHGSTSGNLDSVVVTLQEIRNDSAFWGDPSAHGGTGNDTQTLVRNFIRAAHQEWGVSYVLIGGDDDVMPSRKVWVEAGAYEDELPADIYFTGLDGDWDNDGDGIYGEPSGKGGRGEEADLLAEAYVGRATVSDIDEAWNFVNKTIRYEKGYVGQYSDDLLFVGEKLSNEPIPQGTWGGDYKNDVYDLVLRDEGLDLETLYEKDGTFSRTAVLQRMGAGVHIINHMGHGSYGAFADLSINDVKGLHNDLPFILYTQACMVAGFDEKMDNPGDCIAEEFIKGEWGAVAFIGNSRYGWYAQGSTEGSSQQFDISFFSQVFDDDVRQLGRALSWSKEENLNQATEPGTIRWVYLELNLLGDPETMVLKASQGEHDLSIKHFVAERSVLDEVARTSAQVQNLGQFSEIGTVRLLVDGALASSSQVNLVPGESAWVEFDWTPSEYRPHELRAEVICAIDEIASNNAVDLTAVVDRRISTDELWEGENRSLPGGIIIDPGVVLEVRESVVSFSPLITDQLLDVQGALIAGGTTFNGPSFRLTSNGTLDLLNCHLIGLSVDEPSRISGILSVRNSSIQGGRGWHLDDTVLLMESSSLIDQTSEWSVSGSLIELEGVDGRGGFGMRLSNVTGSLRNVTWSGGQRGLTVEWSTGLLMHDLRLSGNDIDIEISGDRPSHFLHDLEDVNLTEGRLTVLDHAQDTVVEGGTGCLYLVNCQNLTVKGWSLRHAGVGLGMISCTEMVIEGNAMENCSTGLMALDSDGVVWSNDLLNNQRQVRQVRSDLSFGLSYPTGGNHWSDLLSVDVMNGPAQDLGGPDGMADHAYIDDDVLDRYPKVHPCSFVHDVPAANFTMDADVLDILGTVTFTDASVSGSGIGNWTWDMGDGTWGYGSQVGHRYSTKGMVTVTLTVTDHKGSVDSISTELEVVNRRPVCDLSYSPSQPAPGDTVSFLDLSEDVDGGIVSRWWYLGDELLSNGTSFEHVFPNAGDYYINLTIMDAEGQSDSCSRKVPVGNSAPMASFTWTPSYITSLQTVAFGTDCVDLDGHIVSWSWDFGDGTVGNGAAVTHRFTKIGTYLVKLTVTDDDGATGTSSRSLAVNNARPTASFDCPEQVMSMVEMQFKDRSFDPDGTVRSWSWDFGDGGSSTTPSPAHTFQGPGSYNVSLSVRDNLGSVGSASRVIVVINRPPQVFIATPDVELYSFDEVELVGNGTDVDGNITSYHWDLGDGHDASGEVVRHSYTRPGNYTVTLTLLDDAGGSSNSSIVVNILNLAPQSSILVEQSPDHPRERIFHAEAEDRDGSIDEYDWSFGEGSFGQGSSCAHRFAEDGEYLVRLMVVDDQGTSTNVTLNVTVWTGDLSMENSSCVHDGGGWLFSAELVNDGLLPADVVLKVSADGHEIERSYRLEAGERRIVNIPLGELDGGAVVATLLIPDGWDLTAGDNSWTGEVARGDVGQPWTIWAGLGTLAVLGMAVTVVLVRRR